ncbi:MAG: hypothetical protein OXE80_11870 [Gammaproteobacteria bacterium]|nr:hypothetical protein [Gammaproteobacteria bacterium]MCY4182554.1 hypothetical protein [Gammaproteobacteria bacterium]MCY4270855.1 hypothetical protein [Gammaproteobacteria bacterium]MCY4295460.1 hypothetical protein [Gammaproteobacteria bacterium]
MSKSKPAGIDPDQTLATLDQLSHTITVMSAVIERLKRQLRRELRQREEQLADNPAKPSTIARHSDRVLH